MSSYLTPIISYFKDLWGSYTQSEKHLPSGLNLPNEIELKILSHLPFKDLITASSVL